MERMGTNKEIVEKVTATELNILCNTETTAPSEINKNHLIFTEKKLFI